MASQPSGTAYHTIETPQIGAPNFAMVTRNVRFTRFAIVKTLTAPIWGVSMVWYAVPLGWLANFLISYGYYRTGKWKEAVSKTVD